MHPQCRRPATPPQTRDPLPAATSHHPALVSRAGRKYVRQNSSFRADAAAAFRRRISRPNFTPISGSFLPKIPHSGGVFRALHPVFCLFLQNEPNSVFSITHSFHNTSTFFRWVRLAETLFYIKSSPPNRSQSCSSGRLGRPAVRLSKNHHPHTTAATPRPAQISITDSGV